MEPHLEHTHGRHYDNPDILTAGHVTGHDYNEEEHHGEKKSVIKKVKEKAKKLKNTITKHGHGHNHDHDDDEDDDDDDDETVEDPEVHGAPMYDSARVAGLGGPDAIFAQGMGNLERPSVMYDDRFTEPWARQGAPPPVSYGTNLSQPSGVGYTQAYGHDQVNPQAWRGQIGQHTGVEEDPFAPNPTRVGTPIDVTNPSYGQGQDVNQGGLRGIMGKSTGMVEDPHAPKDPSRLGPNPSNYETKVTDPTHAGGKEASLSQIQHSLDKMCIGDDEHKSDYEPKSFDPNHPENLPRETITGKISSSASASAIAEKAAAAKDVLASKLGYSAQNPTTTTGSQEPVKNSGSATDYAHMITDKVTGTLAPVYEKVVETGSSVISKVQGTVAGSGTGTGTGTGTSPRTDSGTVMAEKDKMPDKGVSVKEYLVETLRPGEEDKALSDVITNAFHRGNQVESEKKSGEDRPVGIVTESVEVRTRLGTDRRDEHEHNSGNVSADKNVTERLRDAMGSWFGGKGDAPQGTLGTSYVTDHGLSSNPAGEERNGSGRAQRVKLREVL